MRSPARAIVWAFRQPHRWALIANVGYLLILDALQPLIFGQDKAVVTLDPPDGNFALVLVPLSFNFIYFLALFSFGLAGDLAARQSIYPARMFTLPVTTAALAGWPMLYGSAAMVTLWLITALFAPWGLDLRLIWPAVLGAVFLAWTQVFMWMAYGLPGLRVIVTVFWLAALDAIVILAIHYEVPERVMVAFLAPQLPLAYLAAYVVVARARRGDVPDWRGLFARRGPLAGGLADARKHFSSPGHAQLWFEWRRHGRTLPALVGIVVPFELGLLFIPGNDTPLVIFSTLLCVLFTPPFLAAFVAVTVSTSNPETRDSYGVTPFMAARPLTSAALIAAKLKMAIWSTLAAWLIVLIAIPLALILSGAWPVVIERARQTVEVVGTPRAIVLLLLGCAGLLVLTWNQLVQTLYIGLTGREWIIKSSGLVALSFLVIIVPVAQWLHDNIDVQVALVNALPSILAVLSGVKLSAAIWIAPRLYDGRLLSNRTLVGGAACWLAAVLALYALLVWLVDTPFIPHYFLALVAILSVPLARLSAAPLALAWNRHR